MARHDISTHYLYVDKYQQHISALSWIKGINQLRSWFPWQCMQLFTPEGTLNAFSPLKVYQSPLNYLYFITMRNWVFNSCEGKPKAWLQSPHQIRSDMKSNPVEPWCRLAPTEFVKGDIHFSPLSTYMMIVDLFWHASMNFCWYELVNRHSIAKIDLYW